MLPSTADQGYHLAIALLVVGGALPVADAVELFDRTMIELDEPARNVSAFVGRFGELP